jgi:hypothetical protein
MKKTSKVLIGLALIVGLNSCGVNKAWILNQNQNATQVHLGENNFKVVGQVKGKADTRYILIFGGSKKKNLYNAAYAEMLKNADLNGGARTLTNFLTEEHLGGATPFYYKRTVTVTANVVEFIN